MDLLDLFASITLDTDGYEQGLNKAQQSAESAASSITSSSNNIANSFETQQNRLNFLAVAYDEAVENASKIAASFNASADESGLASESTQELAKALDAAQKEAKAAADRLEKYQASIDAAANETNSFVKANENISQSVGDVNKALSTEESAIEASAAAAAQSGFTISEYFNVLKEGFTEIGNRITEIPSSLSEFADKSKNALTSQSNQLKVLKNEYKEAKDKVKDLKLELSASVNSTGAASEQTKELAKQLKEAENAAASAKKELKDFNDKTNKNAETLKAISVAAKAGASAVTAIATAAAAAGAAMIKVTSDTAAYADNIDKASQKLGVSAEFYQEWEAVLQHSGTSMSSMTATFKTLANAAQDMSADQQAAFEKLGISIEDVASLSTEDLFEQVISGLQQMEEGTERTAIATDLLGRGAMEMGALLNTSAEDTQKMIDTVHELGGVMSDEAVKAGAAFQDSLQDLKTSLNGLKNNLAAEFLPSMVEVMDGLAAVFSGDSSGIEKAKEGIQNFIDELSEQLPKVADFGGEVISALLEGISDNLTDITGVAVDIIGELVTELISLAPTLVDSAVEIIDQLFGFLQENAYVIADGAVSIITSLVNGISDLLPDLIPATVDIVMQVVKGITDNAGKLVAAALQLIMSLGAGLIEALPQLAGAIISIPESIADSLVNYDWASVAEQTMTNIADALDNAQKQVQIWLDNTFSGGTVYGGDIANVDTTDFVKDMRDGTDIIVSEMSTAQKAVQTYYNDGKEILGKSQSDLANSIADTAREFEEQSKKNAEIIAQAIEESNNNIAISAEKSGNNIISSDKKTGEKQKSVLAQNMEALERLYKQRQITEEQYQKQRLEYLEKNRNEESDEWTKYYDNVQTYYEKLAQTEEQAAQKAAQEREKSFKTIIDAYSKQVEQIQSKISSFADKLTGAYKNFYTFETDEAGNITSAYATDKMTQAGKQLEEYYNQLLEFSERGIGGDMISQLADFSQEEGLATLEYWNSLTDQEIKNLQAHYDKVTNLSNKVSELLHKGEAESTAEAFANEIAGAVENDEQFKNIGELMLSGIIEGLNNGAFDITEAASRISGAFNSYFESGAVSSGYAGTSPIYTQTVATTSFPVAESAAAASTPQGANVPASGESGFNIEIHIDEFNNYTEDDVETLADKVLQAIQGKIKQRQAAYS